MILPARGMGAAHAQIWIHRPSPKVETERARAFRCLGPVAILAGDWFPGLPSLRKNRDLQNQPRTRISCHAALDEAARAPFSKERRMRFARATKFHRKSGEGAWHCGHSCQCHWFHDLAAGEVIGLPMTQSGGWGQEQPHSSQKKA